jgi:hypothetical protein
MRSFLPFLLLPALAACHLIADFGEGPRVRDDRDGDAARKDDADGVVVDDAGDAGDAAEDRPPIPQPKTCEDPAAGPTGGPSGYVYFRLENDGGWFYRVKAEEGAQVEDVAQKLRDAGPAPVGSGWKYEFRDTALSPEGAFLSLQSPRWEAGREWPYLMTTANWKGSRIQVDLMPGSPNGRALLARDAAFIVFEQGAETIGSTDGEPLYLATRNGAGFDKGTRVTGVSPMPVHFAGGLSPDGSKVVSLCVARREDRVEQTAMAICETDLTAPYASRVAIPRGRAGLTHVPQVHMPSYDRDGAILFAANWREGAGNDFQVWRLRKGCDPVMVSNPQEYNLDACALPNGNLAMKTKDAGGHYKIRIMRPDRSSFLIDVPDPVPAEHGFTNDTRLFCTE